MSTLASIIQPERFRCHEAPDWAFFPSLRLLFGWGPGVRETIPEPFRAVRTQFLVGELAAGRSQDVFRFMVERHEHDAGRLPQPMYVRSVSRCGCICAVRHPMCSGFVGPSVCIEQTCYHELEANEAMRVRCEVSLLSDPTLFIESRTKTLHPIFVAKMETFGLRHEHGVGKRNLPRAPGRRQERKQRDAKEQAYVEYVEGLKTEFRTLRSRQLLESEIARPPRFPILMAEMRVARHEAVLRGRRGPDGRPYRDYSDDELVHDACHAMASTEASDQMFQYAWAPVARFDVQGLALL